MKKQRICIYGGTFNPPHMGHVRSAEAFVKTIVPDKLIIMPDHLPPHKSHDGIVTAEDRAQMCRLAFSHIKNAEISEREIKRGGKSYTAVTLAELSSPTNELYFLVGTDMLLTLDRWYESKRIFELSAICYVRREADKSLEAEISKKIKEYEEKYSARVIPVPAETVEVSSTEIRSMIKQGMHTELIPELVMEYIQEKGLYR